MPLSDLDATHYRTADGVIHHSDLALFDERSDTWPIAIRCRQSNVALVTGPVEALRRVVVMDIDPEAVPFVPALGSIAEFFQTVGQGKLIASFDGRSNQITVWSIRGRSPEGHTP